MAHLIAVNKCQIVLHRMLFKKVYLRGLNVLFHVVIVMQNRRQRGGALDACV